MTITATSPDRTLANGDNDEIARRAGGHEVSMSSSRTLAPELVLTLADLVQDENGDVVLFNDSQLRSLGIAAEVPVVRKGIVETYRTAAGDDVSGFRYLAFGNGLTLYYASDLDIVVDPIVG